MATDQTLALKAINLALLRLGVSQTITSLEDNSREAYSSALLWDHELRACLRHFPWPFATKYADLELVEGSEDDPTNGDWTYAYAYPDDCLFARRIVPASRRDFDRNPITFRIGRLADQLIVFTDEPDAVLEYTAVFDCPAHLGDELFVDALAWRLAASLAPALSRDQKMGDKAIGMYMQTLEIARTVGSREQQQQKPGEAEWIDGR